MKINTAQSKEIKPSEVLQIKEHNRIIMILSTITQEINIKTVQFMENKKNCNQDRQSLI